MNVIVAHPSCSLASTRGARRRREELHAARRRREERESDLTIIDDVSSPGELRRELEETRAALHRTTLERDEALHRISNSLQLASILLKNQRRRVEDRAARDALVAAEARLLGIAQLHRHLYQHGGDGTVAMAPFVEGLARDLEAGLGLDCTTDCDGLGALEVPSAVLGDIALAVNELALNALKHGYGGADGGHLGIACRVGEDGLVVTVSDHGAGLRDDFDIDAPQDGRRGLGMLLVAHALRKLDGTIEARSSDGGAVFTLRVPLARPARAS